MIILLSDIKIRIIKNREPGSFPPGLYPCSLYVEIIKNELLYMFISIIINFSRINQ
nr:MAG TPA: hypothetical protein [Caudoviricetes sp.]